MAIITSPVTIAKVSSTIGCATNDVGTLCAKSLSGGVGGYAYKIRENGYTATDGYLLPGAKPYYNIMARNNPSEWYINDSNVIVNRLKRNPTTGSVRDAAYWFNLAEFNGYDHSSSAISINTTATNTYINNVFQWSSFTAIINLGDVDWYSVFSKKYNMSNYYIKAVVSSNNLNGLYAVSSNYLTGTNNTLTPNTTNLLTTVEYPAVFNVNMKFLVCTSSSATTGTTITLNHTSVSTTAVTNNRNQI